MKLFFCILILSMTVTNPIALSQGLPTVYWEFRDSLKTFVTDPALAPYATAVQQHMADYKTISESGALKALRRRDPMKIDIILQDWYRTNDGSDAPRANKLQSEAKRVLDSIKYRVIGYDLVSENPWRLDSTMRPNIQYTLANGIDLEKNAAFKYGTENKKVLVVGLQDPLLAVLTAKLKELCDSLYSKDHQQWTRYSYFKTLAIKLQSELALAKLMIGLDEKYETRGALLVCDLYNDHLIKMLKFFRAETVTFGSLN